MYFNHKEVNWIMQLVECLKSAHDLNEIDDGIQFMFCQWHMQNVAIVAKLVKGKL
jgi:hypothetical protein